MLNEVEKQIRAGIATDDINTLVHEMSIRHRARPAPLIGAFKKRLCLDQ
jgi:hypothetical protein